MSTIKDILTFLTAMMALLIAGPAYAQAAGTGEVTAWTDTLREAGGWGVAIVEGVVIWWLYRDFGAKITAKDEENKALNARILGIVLDLNTKLGSLKSGGV